MIAGMISIAHYKVYWSEGTTDIGLICRRDLRIIFLLMMWAATNNCLIIISV